MQVIRVENEWQRAGVHFVRTKGMCQEFDIELEMEFSEDTPQSLYILAFEGKLPVSTCRIRMIDEVTGKIERVCTLTECRSKGYGAAVIKEAENWLRDMGAKKVVINSREAALNFYIKQGYTPDYSTKSGGGIFVCVEVSKEI